MKRLGLLLAIFVLSLGFRAFAQPKIQVIDGTQLDFGDVFHGKRADKVITVKNVGTDTLKITEVRAQCGCTAALMNDNDKRLGPGQSGKLSISFDTHNYTGRVSKQVYISSNDTSNAKVTVTFTTNVIDVLSVDPRQISFDNLKLDSTYTRTVTIANPSDKNSIKILSVESKAPQLKLSIMKNQLMPGEKTQIQAVYTPDKTGTFQGDIEITTDHPANPKLTIKYFVWVNKK